MASPSLILDRVATLAVRQERSKLAPTASQASETRAVAFTAERVLVVFMALPFSVDYPELTRSRPAAPTSLFQHGAGHPLGTRRYRDVATQ